MVRSPRLRPLSPRPKLRINAICRLSEASFGPLFFASLILLVPTMSSDLAKELDDTSNPRHELRQQPLTATSLPSLISVNPLQGRRLLEKPCPSRFDAE